MCKCNMKKFHENEGHYRKKLIQFHCRGKEKHLLLVCFWKKHPYSSSLQDHMEKECRCSSVDADKYCDFCSWISYLLNFKTYKVCTEHIPKILSKDIITTGQNYKKVKCELLLRFNKNTHSFKVFLDNPHDPPIPKIVD